MRITFAMILLPIFFSMSAFSAEAKKVLIQFKSDASTQLLRESAIENYLKLKTSKNRQQLFRDLNLNSLNIPTRDLWIAEGSVAQLTDSEIKMIEAHPSVQSVAPLNRKAKIIEPVSTSEAKIRMAASKFTYGLEKIKIPELNQRFPEITGAGISVGVIDTGIDPRHPDLAGKLILFKDFTDTKNQTPRDDHGHGTHVAGTIAGADKSGQAIGVAPNVKLFIAKGFNSRGNSTDEGLLQALQWMLNPDGNSETADAPKVVSNSWELEGDGHTQITPADEPFCRAIDTMRAAGMAVVFAAGNDGPSSSTVIVPGACPTSITVGATNDRNQIASFSSRGPVRWKNIILVKPDISAPGQSVDSAEPGGDYTTKSGTSMAAPHVAGGLALIFQMNPKLDVAAAQDILLGSTEDFGSPGFDNIFGTGRMDVLKAIETTPAP